MRHLGHNWSIAPQNKLVPVAYYIPRRSFVHDVTQRRLTVSYRRFGTTYRSHLQASSLTLNIGPIGYPESRYLTIYAANIPEQRRSPLHRGRSLKLRLLQLHYKRRLVNSVEGTVLLFTQWGMWNRLKQRFSNFCQVGTTFITQNVLRSTLLLSPSKTNCLRFSATVCDTPFTLILFFLSFMY
jgi:hypothetical protein